GGQESSTSTESALQDLAECDLIIDATADPQIFNLCASISRSHKKSYIWGEVFGGGIGGLICRARPELDPPPHSSRRQIANWCREQGIPWDGTQAGDYHISRDDLPPLIADDGDVSVIASHM